MTGSALWRWSLVLALHAALLWLGNGLLKPAAPADGPLRLTSVRLISAALPPPPPPRPVARSMAGARPKPAPTPVLAEPEERPVTSASVPVAAAEPSSSAASTTATALALDAGTISRAIRGSQSGMTRAQARGVGKEDELHSPRPDQMAEAIKKTERRDCRHAYGGAGLLALIPLAISAVTDTGCKW